MTTLTEKSIIKSRSGVYSDTSENRRKNRVGQKYGADGKSDDDSKDSKKESLTSEKELEAVNKVIQAIAAGKVNLPNAEVVKLYEKRRDLETKVKQATDENSKEKPESSKKEEPKKESEKKSSKVPERAKDYEVDGKKYKVWSDFEKRSTLAEDENGTVRALSTSGYVSSDKTIKKVIKEQFGAKEPEKKESRKDSKSEQLDKDIESIKVARDKESVGSERWKNLNNVWNQLMDKRQNQKLREEQKNKEKEPKQEAKETSKKINEAQKKDSGKKEEVDNLQRRKELSEKVERLIAEKKKKFPNPDIESPMSDEEKRLTKEIADTWSKINKLIQENRKTKEESKSEPKHDESEESYTRVKFEDVPNSGKVNLKKYLSEKMKKSADEAWGDISKIDTKGLQKMEKGLVEDFNRQFDDLPKSRRAEKLYAITKVKGELAKRGKETQSTETNKKSKMVTVSYREFNKQNQPVTKEKEVSEKGLQKFIEKIKEKDNFYDVLAYSRGDD